MIRRFPIALTFSLLLLGCDRQESKGSRNGETNTEDPVPRRKVAQREAMPDQPAMLREKLEDVIAMDSPPERERALAEVAWNAIEIDPDIAHRAFEHLPADSPEKIRLIQHYAMRLTEQNADEALEWAASLGSEQEKSAAMGQIALTIAEADPQRAANLLSESGIAGRDFDVALVQVIQRWATKSAPDAAAWVSSFPPGAAREASLRFIAERWLPSDAAGAFKWLDSMQDSRLRVETARAIEGIMLQQPADIRTTWLQHADSHIQGELEQQRESALKDMGDNIPRPPK